MKKVKHLALYQEPLIKVVSFTVELGLDGSFGGGSEGGEDGPDIPIGGDDIPLGVSRSNGIDAAATSHFGGF